MPRYAVRNYYDCNKYPQGTKTHTHAKKISVSLSGDQARALRQSIALNQITGLLPTPARSPKKCFA